MKTFANLAQFKALLKVGEKVHTIFHNPKYYDGVVKLGEPIDRGERKITIVQTNSFALETVKADGKIVDSWCQYPKASETEIKDNKCTIYETSRDGQKYPVLTYTIL